MDDNLLQALTAAPSLEGIKRALFVQPHPDDNEIGAGALMARLVRSGAEVFGLTVTDDHLECPPDAEGLTLRRREALAAMAALGVKNAGFLGFADKTDAGEEEIADKILPVIRALRPDAVFSVDPNLPNECHRDHIKVGRAVRYAVMDAACGFYPRAAGGTGEGNAWQVSVLGQYYTAEPNALIAADDCWQQKLDAVACHASQCSPELLTALDIQGRWFGKKTGGHAEAFRLLAFFQLHCFNLPVLPRD